MTRPIRLASAVDEAWKRFVEQVRACPERPFAEHWKHYRSLAAERDPRLGPLPAWVPDEQAVARSNIGRLMCELGVTSYAELHCWSAGDRAAFWEVAVRTLGIVFTRKPEAVLDMSGGVKQARWLPGAEMNCVDSCFKGDPDRTAIVSARASSSRLVSTSYGELERSVNRVAGGLLAHGFREGDAIGLYMPMTVECVAAYLGIVRAGCLVVSIADSFSATELARRLELGGAVGLVTVDRFVRHGKQIDLLGKVKQARAPRAIVVPSGAADPADLRDGDLLWSALLDSRAELESVTGDPERVSNILFSSGTTGTPKAIPWTHLTPIKCAADGYFHQDVRADDVVAWPTNVGWMMGPWLIYATLINGATMALYEDAPTGPDFVRFVEAAGVTVLGVVPSLVRAWRASGEWRADWSRVRLFSSTGEPSGEEDYLWLMSRAGYRAPVIEYCGGTEIGGGYITGTVVQPAAPATFTRPALGLDLTVLGVDGQPVDVGEAGEVFLLPPSIGLSQRLLNRDHDEAYFAGCPRGPQGETLRRHGDLMERLPGGCYKAQGRADDTMNLGGIKVGSLELERVLVGHRAVAAAGAIAVRGGDGQDGLVVFVVPAERIEPELLIRELGSKLARELNPLFKIHDLVVVDRLPYTASNKLLRRELRRGYTEGGGGRTDGI
jgi:acetyl-CoA synthetase